MKQIIPLVHVMLKSSFGNIRSKKLSSAQKIGFSVLGLLLVLSFTPIVALVYVLGKSFFELLYPLQQEGVVFQIVFLTISLTVFIFSMLSIPGIYYFSKDTEAYLVMPIQSETIVISRFIVALLYEYAITIFFCVPVFTAYFSTVGFSLSAFLLGIIVSLFIPVIPLIAASILVMLIFVGVPFIKNKDTYTYIISAFTIVFALGINYVSQRLSMMNQEALLAMLQSGSNSLLHTFGKFMPHLSFGSLAIVNRSISDLVIFIVIHVVLLFVFIYISKLIYFKGAIGINESGSSHQRLSKEKLTKTSQKKSVYYRYFMKDLNTLIRTPIYFLNSISSVFIFPVLIIIYIISGTLDLSTVKPFLDSFLSNPDFIFVILNIGLMIGMISASINSISATLITREGQNIYFMKMIPIPLFNQILVKTSVGIFISLISMLFLVIPIVIVIDISFIYIIAILITGTISIVFANLLSACVDVIHPKLNWDNENQAMKQNVNVALLSFGYFSLTALIGGLTFTNLNNNLILGAVMCAIVLLTLVLFVELKKLTVSKLEQVDL